MKSAARFALVLVTAPDLRSARALARAALKARLIACANLVPRIESHYWWQGRIERATEVLLLMKTQKSQLAALERFVLQHHPYDIPEVLSLSLDAGTAKYLDWLDENTTRTPLRRPGVRNAP